MRGWKFNFEIKGNGEVDGDILNKFHGVHFGDEIESDDLPKPFDEDPVEEESSSDDTTDAADE